MTRMTIAEVVARLDALLAVSSGPPPANDPDQLLEAFSAMADERAPILTELVAIGHELSHEPAVRDRLTALVARDQAWIDALSGAQTLVGSRIGVVRKAARAYAR